MIPLLIVAGFVGLYWLIENQKQATASAALTQASNVAQSQTALATGGSPTIGTLATEQQNASEESAAVSATAAIPIAGPAIAAIGSVLLGQHTARLKGATNENMAADQTIPAFDADLAQIAAAYNAGQITAAQAYAGLVQIDAQIYAYLKSQVGAPGTSWSPGSNAPAPGSTGVAPAAVTCNSACTVGCCIYYNDLRPAIFGSMQYGNGTTGMVQALQAGSGSVYVPEVYPPSNTAYGNYQRASYTLTLTKPATVAQQNSGVLAALGL